MGSLLTLLAKRGSAPFTPASIPNLALWLDASDTSSITHSSGGVSQWNDKSGNGRHVTQPTSLNRPVTGTRTLNGKNVIDFDGTQHGLIVPSGLYSLPNGANTVFVVFASDNAGDATQYLLAGFNVGSGLRYEVGFTATNLEVQNRTDSNTPTNMAAARDTGVHIVGFRRSGTSITPIRDGVAGTAGSNAQNFTASSMSIGSNGFFNAGRLNGVIAEIAAYSADISTANANLFGNYAASKWGSPWAGL